MPATKEQILWTEFLEHTHLGLLLSIASFLSSSLFAYIVSFNFSLSIPYFFYFYFFIIFILFLFLFLFFIYFFFPSCSCFAWFYPFVLSCFVFYSANEFISFKALNCSYDYFFLFFFFFFSHLQDKFQHTSCSKKKIAF
jgi:hypothetical protein